MNCPQCAADNIEGSERCWQCGVILRPPAEPRSRQSWVVWLVVGAVALGALLLMFSASGGTSGGGSSRGGSGSTIPSGSVPAKGSVPATKTK